MSEFSKNKEEISCQKAFITGFELQKLVSKSKNLSGFIKANNGGILPVSIKAVLSDLCTFYNPEKNCIFPKIADIAEETCLSKISVIRIIEFLHKSGLVLRQENFVKDNRRNFYVFTGKFWDLVLPEVEKFFSEKKVSRCYLKNENRYQADTYLDQVESQQVSEKETDFEKEVNNMSYINNKKNDFEKFLKNLKHPERINTDLQFEFREVIDQLTPYEWQEYRDKDKFEKRNYLENKQKEQKRKLAAIEAKRQTEIDTEKACTPLDFSRDQALEWLQSLPKRLHSSYFAMQVKAKWSFSTQEIRIDDS